MVIVLGDNWANGKTVLIKSMHFETGIELIVTGN